MQIEKKLSIAIMNGVRGGFKNVKETTHVGRIFGIVRSVETKSTSIGDSLCFKGDFRGINADGEEFISAVCYLISPADEMLAQALIDPANAGKEVRFGFDFFVTPKEKKTPLDLGYSYQVKPLLETKPSDAMAELMASAPALPNKPKQLTLESAAPTAQPEPEPAPAAEPEKATPKKK